MSKPSKKVITAILMVIFLGSLLSSCSSDSDSGSNPVSSDTPQSNTQLTELEPNNELAEANAQALFAENKESLGNADDFSDLYRIEIPADKTSIKVRLTFKHDEGDLLLLFRDSEGDELTRVDKTTNLEFLSAAVPGGGGIFYLDVRPFNVPTGNSYTLSYILNDATSGGPHEPDDNVSQTEERATLEVGQVIEAFAEDPIDVYAIDIPAGQTLVDISLKFDHEGGDLQLILADHEETDIAVSFSNSDDENIQFQVPRGIGFYDSRYYIAVFSSEQKGTPYALSYSVSEPFTADIHEPNNGFSDADEKGTFVTSAFPLSGTADFLDVYRIEVPAGEEQLDTTLTYLQEDQNLGLFLVQPSEFDPDSPEFLARAREPGDNEVISLRTFTGGGVYYLAVVPQSRTSQGIPYTLSLALSQPTALALDSHEPDDTISESNSKIIVPEGEAAKVSATMTEDQGDIFSMIVVPEGRERVHVVLEFPEGADLLAVSVLDSEGEIVAADEGVDGRQDLFAFLPDPGEYYLQVNSVGPAQGEAYTLWYELLDAYSGDREQSIRSS